jgi:hypothetical protein
MKTRTIGGREHSEHLIKEIIRQEDPKAKKFIEAGQFLRTPL